jgi:hypothetical protein
VAAELEADSQSIIPAIITMHILLLVRISDYSANGDFLNCYIQI